MRRTLLSSLLMAAFAAPAFAAPGAFPEIFDDPVVVFPSYLAAAEDAGAQAEAWKRWSEDVARDVRASMGTLFAGRVGSDKVVKGAPYSAEVITETNQPLADGNAITKKTQGSVYRDAEGRTRQDSGTAEKDRSAFISDPVAGKYIVLTPGSKRATVTSRPRTFVQTHNNKQVVRIDGDEVRVESGKHLIDGQEVRVENGKVFLNGQEVSGTRTIVKSKSGKEVRVENGRILIDGKEIGTGSPTQVIVKHVDAGDGTSREEVRVQVVRAGDGSTFAIPPMPPMPPQPPGGLSAPLAPLPPMPGLSTLRFENMGKLGKGVTANLGTKDFDGVKAEGKSTTWTIPAGEIGNRAPIQVVSESWYAPELQVTVYSRYSDPRTGESLYRLTGIRRGEPSAALFTVPEGYEMRDRAAERERAREERQKERQTERRKPG